jgi:hypothetical protein
MSDSGEPGKASARTLSPTISKEEPSMDFRITGLAPEPFLPLFGLSDAQLARHGALRLIADRKPCYPDRIELRDAEPGESVLLLNYTHLPVETPYRSSYAIYVREGARSRYDRVNEVPEQFRSRVLSLRAFDENDMLRDADIVAGTGCESLIERLLSHPETAYIHAHFAKYGCFAARIDRAWGQGASGRSHSHPPHPSYG